MAMTTSYAYQERFRKILHLTFFSLGHPHGFVQGGNPYKTTQAPHECKGFVYNNNMFMGLLSAVIASAPKLC
jgi:hypothetical protein